jgi:hypothetical protein
MGEWASGRKGDGKAHDGRAKNSARRKLNFYIERIRAGFEPFRGAWHPLALANQVEAFRMANRRWHAYGAAQNRRGPV